MSNPEMIDDKALVGQVLRGDQQAFRMLIKQHERLVSHMIGRLIDKPEDREELCQDVFLKVHEKLKEFTFQSKLSTWIATIAYRHGINHLRKRKIKISDLPEDETHIERFIAVDDASETLADAQLDQIVLTLVEKLPPQYKAILTLYHVQEMSYPEIVEITGLPEGTVKNYLFRARQLLKEKVKQYLGKEAV
ncbi:MAG: sigma-70 family RNA polymerase sigma factor [Cyclobacteriaceae bacterium]|nr:sigma-70 family RNA polymerase sigma factor [Bacteroidetes bacterium CHB5]QLH33249.1 MAG: sigma-70 family RNA polymerase sigma factor [Cyclobacteriaceae bacterium]